MYVFHSFILNFYIIPLQQVSLNSQDSQASIGKCAIVCPLFAK